MTSTVDVRINRAAAATLTPTSRSIINGDTASITVRTCVLGNPLYRRIEMSLTVDAAVAAQFSRACRRQTVWDRVFFPSVLVLALAFLIASETDAITEQVDAIWSPVMFVLIAAVAVGRFVLSSLASPHHPRRQGRHTVLVRGVDRNTAEAWVHANSPELIRLVE